MKSTIKAIFSTDFILQKKQSERKDNVYLVEGYTDVISLYRRHSNVVAPSDSINRKDKSRLSITNTEYHDSL